MRKTVAAVAALVLLGSLVAAMPVSARLQRPQVVRGDGTSAPRAVLGIREDPRGARATKAARAHLRDNSQTYAIEAPDTDLIVEEVIRTDDRATVRFAQQYKGAPVFGAQYLVHMRRSGGGFAAESVNGNFFTDLDVSVAPRFSERAARRLAFRRFRQLEIEEVEGHGLTVLPGGSGTPTYHFTLEGSTIGKMPVKQEVFVNARTGAIPLAYNNIKFDGPIVGTGVDSHGESVPLNLYKRGSTIEARDQSRDMFEVGGEITTHDALGEDYNTFLPSDANIATDVDATFDGPNTTSGAVDAHWGAGRVYEYFLTLGRDSIDGEGMNIISVVNAGDFGGAPMYNAFWDGEKVTYGNPDPSQLHPLSADLDIVAHELTHGVTEFSGNLVYLGQSGAMNEAYSDYFGNALDVDVSETQMDATDAGFIGEDICKVPQPDGWECPLRDLNDGRTTNDYVYYLSDIDGGGVHLNSTIYGGSLWNIREQLPPERADLLVYTALTEFTTPLDGFTDGRNSVIAAASALEFSDDEVDIVTGAFDDAAIVEGWDEVGGSDSDVLIENFAPLGFVFSPPEASGPRYVAAHYLDPLQLCCEPAQIVVGNLDGTGEVESVGQHDDPETLNDELPDLSGDLAVWAHITQGSNDIDFEVNGRRLGGGLKKIASARGFQWYPAVDGNLVAWEDTRRGDTNIWARRLGKKSVKVSGKFGEEYEPEVSGDWIAWHDVPDFGEPGAIGLMNFKTGKKVRIKRPGRAYVGAPAISGRYVYWYEDSDFFTNRSGAGFGTIMRARRNGKEIKALFKETHKLAPVFNGFTTPPKVSANNKWVVYHEEFGYSTAEVDPLQPASQIGRDVFMVRAQGGAPKFVSCNKGDQAFPSIGWGQRVVYMDSSRLSTDLVTKASPAETC